MPCIKNIIIAGAHTLPITLDVFFNYDQSQKPILIYAHGFNGFKDWGNFDLIAERFVAAGYTLVKFNFSHNGTTPDHPDSFTNLDAFGNNNYTKQLADLKLMVDWVCDPLNIYQPVINSNQLYLLGHSMGGGIAILEAASDNRVKKLITWAAIGECKTPWANWPLNKIQAWKDTGVAYYHNSRTNQQLPLYFQLYEDYLQNQERLDIEKAMAKLKIPVLICHGSADQAVPVSIAWRLKKLNPLAQLFITDSDHVFGRKHPCTSHALPAAMEAVVNASIKFLNIN